MKPSPITRLRLQLRMARRIIFSREVASILLLLYFLASLALFCADDVKDEDTVTGLFANVCIAACLLMLTVTGGNKSRGHITHNAGEGAEL